MMKQFALTIIGIFLLNGIFASEYYVSKSGSDQNEGKSLDDAFFTIQHGVDQLDADDVLWVDDGVYNEAVKITKSGNENYWITIKSFNKHGAKIETSAGSCLKVEANYIIIDGFELTTSNVYGSGVATAQGQHHITVRNCYAHDCGQSGIQAFDNDYIVVENNIVSNNAWLMPHAGSGISIFGAFRFDDKEGFHNIVRGNICFNNDNGPETAETDGNGIIIDDLKCTQGWHSQEFTTLNGYNGIETLVENNLCVNNGGRGIQVYLSENVTVRNNTCFHNNKREGGNATWRGEIGVSNSDHIVLANNIVVCNSDMGFDLSKHNSSFLFGQYGDHETTEIICKNNLTYNVANSNDDAVDNQIGAAVEMMDNVLAVNPEFVNPTLDLTDQNYSLNDGSAAIDAGTIGAGFHDTDLAGNNRVNGISIDIGCYETPVDSTETGVNHLPRIFEPVLYPNPVENYLFIKDQNQLSCHDFFAKIYALNGMLLFQFTGDGNQVYKLDVQSLNPGPYIVEFYQNQSLFRNSFIKL